MQLDRLEEIVELMQVVGYTLTIQQRLKLSIANIVLHKNYPHVEQFKFWGKIQGTAKTYYILVGLKYSQSYQFPHKSFFYATSPDIQFKQLPDLLVQHEQLPQKYNSMPFVGDPAKILVNLQGEPGQQQQPPAEQGQNQNKPPVSEQQQQLKKVPKKNFTELHRLSYVVRAIQYEVQCVPRDSFKMNPSHDCIPNKHFYGLQASTARSPSNWLHFKAPQRVKAKQTMNGDNVLFSPDFLDSIQQDFPKGQWSLQLDSRIKYVSLRSFLWQGYYAIHQLNTDLFGSVYIGDGSKNIDLPFMI